MKKQFPFHIALPVKNVAKTKEFYVDILELPAGREDKSWIDIDFFGNQITFQENPGAVYNKNHHTFNQLNVPISHFGVILDEEQWTKYKQIAEENNLFFKKPKVFFENQIGEQSSFFIQDPSGYSIEFKLFINEDEIFTKNK
jgi:hypothetical protein